MAEPGKEIEVPKGIIIHKLEIDIRSASKGLIQEVRIEYSMRPPYSTEGMRGVAFLSPKSPFPTMRELLQESIKEITE